jgi:hypothetical protein
MGTNPQVLPEELESATLAHIVASIRRDDYFLSSMTFRQHCAPDCRILYTERHCPVSRQLIATLFNVDRGTVWNRWRV